MNIVLDTNCLLMSLSRRSRYYPVWRDFVDGKYTLCITNEILSEYEEILTAKVGPEIASNIINAILDLPNTRMVHVSFPHIDVVDIDEFMKVLISPTKVTSPTFAKAYFGGVRVQR